MSTSSAFDHGRKTYRHMHSRSLPADESIARAVAAEAWHSAADRAAFVAGWMAARAVDVTDRRRLGPFIPLPGFDD